MLIYVFVCDICICMEKAETHTQKNRDKKIFDVKWSRNGVFVVLCVMLWKKKGKV